MIVGRISGVFGVRGWVKVYSYTQPRDNIFNYSPWLINNQAIALESAQKQGKTLIAKLRGYNDRDAVAALIGRDIGVEQLPEIENGEYYWADLIGLDVVNQQHDMLGKVVKLLETGAHDVLVLDSERLIPYVDAYVLAVDVAKGVIRVDWGVDF